MRRFFARLSFGSNANEPSTHTFQNNTSNEKALEKEEFWRGALNTLPSSSSSTTWNPEFASDPTAWEQQFLDCWKKLKKIITSQNNHKMFNEVNFKFLIIINFR